MKTIKSTMLVIVLTILSFSTSSVSAQVMTDKLTATKYTRNPVTHRMSDFYIDYHTTKIDGVDGHGQLNARVTMLLDKEGFGSLTFVGSYGDRISTTWKVTLCEEEEHILSTGDLYVAFRVWLLLDNTSRYLCSFHLLNTKVFAFDLHSTDYKSTTRFSH